MGRIKVTLSINLEQRSYLFYHEQLEETFHLFHTKPLDEDYGGVLRKLLFPRFCKLFSWLGSTFQLFVSGLLTIVFFKLAWLWPFSSTATGITMVVVTNCIG